MMLTAFAFRELDHETQAAIHLHLGNPCARPMGGLARRLVLVDRGYHGRRQQYPRSPPSTCRGVALPQRGEFDWPRRSRWAELAIVVSDAAIMRGIDVTKHTQAVLVSVQFLMLALVSVVALTKVFSHHASPQAVMPQWSWFAPAGLSRVGDRP